MEVTGCVVVDDRADCAGGGGARHLLGEADRAALDERDVAPHGVRAIRWRHREAAADERLRDPAQARRAGELEAERLERLRRRDRRFEALAIRDGGEHVDARPGQVEATARVREARMGVVPVDRSHRDDYIVGGRKADVVYAVVPGRRDDHVAVRDHLLVKGLLGARAVAAAKAHVNHLATLVGEPLHAGHDLARLSADAPVRLRPKHASLIELRLRCDTQDPDTVVDAE